MSPGVNPHDQRNPGGAGNHGDQENQGREHVRSNASAEQSDKGKDKSDSQRKRGNGGISSLFSSRSSQSTNALAELLDKAERERLILIKENECLKQELADEIRNSERLERKVHNLQRYIDNTEHLLGMQASDDKIVARFEALMGRIRTWSLKFTADAPTLRLSEPSQEKLDIYHQVNAKCRTREGLQAVLRDNKRRRLLARGLVAYVISSTIFRRQDSVSPPSRILESKDCQGGDFWLEQPLRGYVCGLESSFDPGKIGHRELNNWRALTIELLTRERAAKGAFPDDTSDYLKQLEKFVMELMAPWVASGMGDTRDGFENLSDILEASAEFSQYLRRQWPCWSVRFPRMPIPATEEINQGKIMRQLYDPNFMRDRQFDDPKNRVAELRGLEVDFVVAPGLYKRGTLEGDHFDRDSIVKKIEVVVCQKEVKLAGSGGATRT